MVKTFDIDSIDRIIQMAWEDRTPFEAIEFQFGLKENEVIDFTLISSGVYLLTVDQNEDQVYRIVKE